MRKAHRFSFKSDLCFLKFDLKVALKRFRATLNCELCILASHRLRPESSWVNPEPLDESQKSNIVKNDPQSGRFGRFLVLMATFEMKQVKLNVLADFSICTHITTRLTNNILKDAISDLTTTRIFKDVCPSTCRVPKRFNWEGFHLSFLSIFGTRPLS